MHTENNNSLSPNVLKLLLFCLGFSVLGIESFAGTTSENLHCETALKETMNRLHEKLQTDPSYIGLRINILIKALI